MSGVEIRVTKDFDMVRSLNYTRLDVGVNDDGC
jgi:hypothetical protein